MGPVERGVLDASTRLLVQVGKLHHGGECPVLDDPGGECLCGVTELAVRAGCLAVAVRALVGAAPEREVTP